MSSNIHNKIVLVTGANRGIGKAIVTAALEQGAAKVYATVRTLESAQPLVKEYGSRVVPIRIDLEDPQSIKSAAAKASDVDVVINNAGVANTAAVLDENAVESLEYEINTNTS